MSPIVGVTGHRQLGSQDIVAWLRREVRRELDEREILRGISCLAIGADQLVVEELGAKGGTYDAVIPCRDYEGTFADHEAQTRYRNLLNAANASQTLDYAEPSEIAFLKASELVVEKCDVLFALWDGKPARGVGGTADVVALARQMRKPWVHFDTIRRSVVAELPM